MKKSISLLLVLVMVCALAACSKKEDTSATAETAPVETLAEEETVNMANPMVEVKDSAEFQKELGIYIDANLLYSEAKMFIVDDTMAECQFSFEDIQGNPVNCTLRATKDESKAETLHGVNATLTDEKTEMVKTADSSIEIKRQNTESGESQVYTWKIDDTWYSFVLIGFPSETELADVKESVLNAIGVEPVAEDVPVAEGEEQAAYEVSADGTVLTVRFPSNPTTGYDWSYKIWDEGSLELVSSNYAQTPGTEGLAGAGGTWTASFQSVKNRNNYEYPTRNYIEFTYGREWEEGNMPSRVVDVNIVGPTIEITGIHEPDFEKEIAPDGTYEVTLNFTDMIEKDDLTHIALIGIPEKILFSDEQVKALKVGDSFNMSEFGGDDYIVSVECLEKTSDTRIVLSDFETLNYDKDLGGWYLMGPNDDVFTVNTATYKVYFTNETRIDDKMEEVYKSGNSGTIYDKMRDYGVVNAKVTVKDGWVSDITIYYHP